MQNSDVERVERNNLLDFLASVAPLPKFPSEHCSLFILHFRLAIVITLLRNQNAR